MCILKKCIPTNILKSNKIEIYLKKIRFGLNEPFKYAIFAWNRDDYLWRRIYPLKYKKLAIKLYKEIKYIKAYKDFERFGMTFIG
jgi:hypothetical protein